jgi:fluoride exporter
LGGYTTFSTFAQETLDLIEGGHIGLALAYSSGSVVAGMAAVWFGALLGRAL